MLAEEFALQLFPLSAPPVAWQTFKKKTMRYIEESQPPVKTLKYTYIYTTFLFLFALLWYKVRHRSPNYGDSNKVSTAEKHTHTS